MKVYVLCRYHEEIIAEVTLRFFATMHTYAAYTKAGDIACIEY